MDDNQRLMIIYCLQPKVCFKKVLKIKIGARVMIATNICISDNLVNGTLGNVIDIVYGDNSSKVKALIVSFNDLNDGQLQNTEYKASEERIK